MTKGVKKVRYISGKVDEKNSKPTQIVALPNETIIFGVREWEDGTTEADKQKGVTWIWQTANRIKIIGQVHAAYGQNFKFTIPPNLCGAYGYYIEASLTGKTDVRKTGVTVVGHCPPKITNGHWTHAPKGSAITEANSYGGAIFLELKTEGLNGYSKLQVEIYKEGNDKPITTISTSRVTDGKVNAEVKTAFWSINFQQASESFFIKVKNPNNSKHVPDNNKNEKHAPLTLKNNFAFVMPAPPTNKSPAKVGSANTNYSKIDPCQYTELKLVNSKGEKAILFKEDKSVKPTPVIHTGVIVGGLKNKSKQKFTIKVDDKSSVKQCPQKTKHTKQLTVHAPTPLNVEIIKDTGKELEFEAWFDYDKVNLFDYFFLTKSKLDVLPSMLLKAETCRYHQEICVKPVPDIEWKFSLAVSSTQPDTYSYTNMPSGIINKNQNDKSLKSVDTRKKLNTSSSPVSFDLKIKATTSKKDSFELSAGYETKIRSILNALISIKDIVDEICNTKKAKASSISSFIKVRKPITLKIDYPVISIVGAWKLGYNIDNPSLVNTQGSISLGFNPLIKGEGAIDLLACLEIYPVAKLVIKAADLVLASVKGEMWFDIYAYGAVNLNGDIFFNKKEIADFQIDTVFGLGVRLGIKAGITTKKISFKGDKKEDVTLAGAELSGRGETTIKLKAKRGLDNEGVFIEVGADFGGMLVYVTAKARIFGIKGGVEDTPFVLLDPKPDFLKKRWHIIS